MIQKDFWDNAMSAAQIKVCHKRFQDGWESVESGPCSGRPATSRTPENVEHLLAAVNKDQWLTVRERETDLGILKTTVSEILTQDLGMKHFMEIHTTALLPEQKEHWATVANALIQTIPNEPDFLRKVITGDEWCVYDCDPEMKAQLSQMKSPGSLCPKKAWQSCNKSRPH